MTSLVFVFVCFLATMALAKECHDTFHSCVSWSKADMCNNGKFGFVMRGGCAKTCGFCTGKSTVPKKNVDFKFSGLNTLLAKKKTFNKAGTQGCNDAFNRCQKWKNEKNICEKSHLKPFIAYGCKKTCGFCDSTAVTSRKATIETAPLDVEKIKGKDFANWRNMDIDDANKQLDVELEISKDMIGAKKAEISKTTKHTARKRTMTTHNKNHKKKAKRMLKKTKIRRVEIETGYKHPRAFSSLDESIDKSTTNNNIEAVSDFGKALNSFDSLTKLPDFDGVNEVNDVQSLLDTPKPNKKLDYYVEQFSKDPYLAYSERQEWLNENNQQLNKFRRRLAKSLKATKRSFGKHSKTVKRQRRSSVHSSHKSNAKKVVIENGFTNEFSANRDQPIANFNRDTEGITNDVNDIKKLPYFQGFDKDDKEKTITNAKLGKTFDYYVEQFSKDPYLAESEREDWMKENGQIRFKHY